jgi:hypothetical protein
MASGPGAGRRAGPAVVHLVRASNGIDPFARFIDSYRRHPAGAPHELVLLLKGFESEGQGDPYRELVADLAPLELQVPDDGFDLGAYRRAALELPHRDIAFLNSFSVILAEGWLGLMLAAYERPRAVAVAASASWGSHRSHMRYEKGLGGAYQQIFADREETHWVFARLAGVSVDALERPSWPQRLYDAGTLARQLIGFDSFPAPHLRTNGLLTGREAWLRACPQAPRDKLAAHRLESGRRGIAARLRADGGELLLASRDGGVFACSDWPKSVTFWQGDQDNLLIGDNQTLAYRDGDAVTRRVLSGYAWGQEAAPVGPTRAEAA